jgi:hypothetical protein
MNGVFGITPSSPALSLARYAHIIGYSDCAFFGVDDPSNVNYACRKIWTGYDRSNIADYLAEAQEEIENVIGYPMAGKWFEDEEHTYTSPVSLNFSRILALGIKSCTKIGDGSAVSYLAEPATVVVPTTLTSTDDIHVYYPDTEEEISPSNMVIAGGNLTISIPKCRLVEYSVRDNDENGIDPTNMTNFQTTVDVVHCTTDTTDQGELVYVPSACNTDCTEEVLPICVYLDNASIGTVLLGKPVSCICSTGLLTKVRINYKAGLTSLTKQMEMAIVRLAHSKMPTEPCGCDITQRLWKRDRNVPEILDRERLNCPFGLSDGAWMAYKMALSMTDYRMTEFVGFPKRRSKWV